MLFVIIQIGLLAILISTHLHGNILVSYYLKHTLKLKCLNGQ